MNTKAAHWADSLPYTICADALAWLRTQPDAQTAWEKSQRGEWMLYHAGKLAGAAGGNEGKTLVLAACACARTALRFIRNCDLLPLTVTDIETAERWARGEANAPPLKKVKRASGSASAAAVYAASAAYASAAYLAYVASDASAYVSDYASAYVCDVSSYASDAVAFAAFAAANDDADDPAAARAKAFAQCADIVRQYYPKVPQ